MSDFEVIVTGYWQKDIATRSTRVHVIWKPYLYWLKGNGQC